MHPNLIEIPLDLRAEGRIEQSDYRVMSTEKEERKNLGCIRTPRHNYSDAQPNRNELKSLSDLDSLILFFSFLFLFGTFQLWNFK